MTDSAELRAAGVPVAIVDEAVTSVLACVRAVLDAERAVGVPVSEAFVERVLTALSNNDPLTGVRRALLSLAWAEYMDGRASASSERPTPVVPAHPTREFGR